MDSAWYIICTKPRTEKKLQSILQVLHVLNVLPTYVKIRKVQRRTVKTDIPIFPGYLMARLSAEDRLNVLKTNLATAVMPLPNARVALRQLHQIMKAAKETEDFRLVLPTEAGDAVRIVNGPMKGLQGRVKTVEGKTILTVNVEAFGGAIEVQVSPEDCVPA